MSKPKILIHIDDGVFVTVYSTEPIEVQVIDTDDQAIDRVIIHNPDVQIVDKPENHLQKIIKKYETD
jgi:hypothetical protein